MTYDRGRRGAQVPVLRDDWREPLRAQRDPLAWESGRARSDRERPRRWRKQSWLGRFVATYGWRAYALPVLTALTAAVVYQAATATTAVPLAAPTGPAQGPPTIGSVGTAIIDAPPRGLTEFGANLPTGMLPDGGPYTEAADKDWHVVPGGTPQVGQGTSKVFRYTVEVENGIDPVPFGGDDAFARMIDQTLANPKGWTHNLQFAFIRVDETATETPDFRISLSSPATVRDGCGYEFPLETSCYNPSFGPEAQPRVFINEARWVRGAVPFEGDVGSYRQYVINHEVGHAIGYLRHESCDRQADLAPVMMQQTFSTADDDAAKFDPQWVRPDGKACRFNPWPYPIS